MVPFYQAADVALYCGDALSVLRRLESESVQTVVTSPPFFGLRDYGVAGQIGLEGSLDAYLGRLLAVFAELRRVLRRDGTVWVELGDSYAGAGYGNHANAGGARREDGGKPRHLRAGGLRRKNLLFVPHRFALALQGDGWICRQDCVWYRPNALPEPVSDRPVRSHSYLFLFAKAERYYYDADAVRSPQQSAGQRGTRWLTGAEPPGGFPKRFGLAGRRGAPGRLLDPRGANLRSVLVVPTQGLREDHRATYPAALVTPCVLAGSRPGDTVLDPFAGSGTTLLVARRLGRQAIGIELSERYCRLAVKRVEAQTPTLPFAESPPLCERGRGAAVGSLPLAGETA